MQHNLNSTKIELGKKGEALVVEYLKQQGFTILNQNYATRCGEIDIIAQKDEVLAFIEVKLRRNSHFYLSELIVPAKQRKICKTALYYIATNNLSDYVYRFDVALVESNACDYTISYIENAFTSN